jgi:hypothetical protein
MAAARHEAPDADPTEDSLIRRLWLRHWGKTPPPASHHAISEEGSRRIMESVRPIIEALRKQEREAGPRFPV